MAVGAKEGWLEVFMQDMTLDRTSKEEEDMATVLKNDLTYDYMVMTCTDDALEYVQVAKTADSHGDAHMAWNDLYKRDPESSSTTRTQKMKTMYQLNCRAMWNTRSRHKIQ